MSQSIDRRERLRRLALETIDLAKDPYYMRNHLGQIECRLCLTLHPNEGNYLAHTQARPCSTVKQHAMHSRMPCTLARWHGMCMAVVALTPACMQRVAAAMRRASATSRTWPSVQQGRQRRNPQHQHRRNVPLSRRLVCRLA